MSAEEVVCGAHGRTPVTFACTHLGAGVACGYHAHGGDDPRWPDALCDRCHEDLELAGDWTDELTARVKVLCTHCYEKGRSSNESPPPGARGRKAALDPDEQSALIATAHAHALALADRGRAANGHASYARWHFDDEARKITFSDPARATLVADVRMVGTFSTRSSTFQWSWETMGDDHPLVGDVAMLRWYGDARRVKRLTDPSWPAEEIDGWEMAQIAAYLLRAELVYRAPFDHLYWWMLLDGVRTVT